MQTQTNQFTASDKQKLRKLMAEMTARGIEIPKELKDELRGVRKTVPFPASLVTSSGRIFSPRPYHQEFIDSNALIAALVGGRGSGKTSSATQKVILKKIAQGQPGAIMNPDFENFKISTWAEFKEWIPWDQVVPKHRHRQSNDWFPQQPFIMTFMNGATVICKGLKEADSARGPNINWLWYDEFGRDLTGEAFRIAVPSVRVGKNPQIILTGTPNGADHWGSKLLFDQEFPEEVKEVMKELSEDRPLIEVFTGSTHDNKPNLDPATFALILTQYAPGTWLYEQEILGNIVSHGGVLGNVEWFSHHVIEYPPENVHDRVRYWDLAATEKKVIKSGILDPDETVGSLLSYTKSDHLDFFLEDQVCGFWEWQELKEMIYQTALRDGPGVKIVFEQEPASGGKNQVAALVEDFKSRLPDWILPKGHNPREFGDKVMRANLWFAEAANGHWYIVRGAWNDGFFKQLGSFPISRHDDRVDSVSGARISIAPVFQWKKIKFLKL